MSILHIVIVEDNPPDVLVFRECLRRRGIAFTIEHYLNGEDAAKAIVATTAPPDVFVLDLNVPRIHGLELLKVIRANPLTARAAVVILTSSRMADDRTRAEQEGADLYLIKPDGFREFVDRVGAAFEDFLNRKTSANGAEAVASACPAKPGRRVRAAAAGREARARRHVHGKARGVGSPR